MKGTTVAGSPSFLAHSAKVPLRNRSSPIRSTSTSAIVRWLSVANRSPSASFDPSSWIVACPSQARSVVLSPQPEAAKT